MAGWTAASRVERMTMGGEGNTVPVWFQELPMTDPRCRNDSCIAFYAAHNASQAQISWASQFQYGWWTSWIYAIVIFLFACTYLWHVLTDRKPQASSFADAKASPSILDKTTAAIRSLSYRRLSGRLANYLALPSLGVCTLLLLFTVALTVMTFAQHPYYRPYRKMGSPPLGVRTGLMAAALIPLNVALAGKVNLITTITGIGHEKLNVFHRAVGWLMFILSLIHTFPFIHQQLVEGGYAKLKLQFYTPGALEFNGTPALAILFGLAVFSLPPCRRLAYELFVWSHVALAIAFLGLCFWHFWDMLHSCNYLWATLAIWLTQILFRTFGKTSAFRLSRPWFDGCPTTIRDLADGGMMRLDVLIPVDWTWSPGQHVFLRFPSIRVWDNHPFTIASIPLRRGERGQDGGEKANVDGATGTMTFYLRAQSGFTRRLHALATRDPEGHISAIVDGPYGSSLRKLEFLCEDVVLVAGGGGVTAVLPWLLHLSRCMSDDEGGGGGERMCVTRRVRVLWMVRKESSIRWAAEAFCAAMRQGVAVDVYVTGEGDAVVGDKVQSRTESDGVDRLSVEISPAAPRGGGGGGAGMDSDSERGCLTKHFGPRPHLWQIIPTLVGSGRTAVVGCGPESLKIDLGNAVAGCQGMVLRGEAREVVLHTETFDW